MKLADDAFYGTSTLSERGQLVIPSEARAEMGFQPGDKLMIMRHPIYKGIIIFKLESVQEIIEGFQMTFDKMKEFSDHSHPHESARAAVEDGQS